MSKRIPAFYVSKNMGNHRVVGYVSKHEYGHFGGGQMIPDGAFPEDIRARPYLFLCGNCRSEFKITGSGEVICSSCSRAQIGSFAVGKPVTDETFIDQPPEILSPPVTIAEQGVKHVPKDIHSGVNIRDLDFGGYSKSRYADILEKKGIVTLDDAIEIGEEGMVAIKGIGPATAKAILKNA